MQKVFWVIVLFICIIFVGGIFYLIDDKDSCLDIGVCKAGLKVNTQYGEIIISKETCVKYGWIWNEKNNCCTLTSKKR